MVFTPIKKLRTILILFQANNIKHLPPSLVKRLYTKSLFDQRSSALMPASKSRVLREATASRARPSLRAKIRVPGAGPQHARFHQRPQHYDIGSMERSCFRGNCCCRYRDCAPALRCVEPAGGRIIHDQPPPSITVEANFISEGLLNATSTSG